MADFAGRCAIVTGAAGEIGRALVQELVRRGARVVGVDADPAVTGLLPDPARAEILDVTDAVAVDVAFRRLAEDGWHPDVLLNNAGINVKQTPEYTELPIWDRVLAVNLTGYLTMALAFARRVIERGDTAAVVNVSSTAATSALGRGNLAYSVSKAGVNQLTRELAVEWAPFGIRVNAVQPGQVRTQAWQELAERDPALYARVLSGIPLGRFVSPSELTGPVLFLASPAAAMITGVALPVDGGNLALNASGSLRDQGGTP